MTWDSISAYTKNQVVSYFVDKGQSSRVDVIGKTIPLQKKKKKKIHEFLKAKFYVKLYIGLQTTCMSGVVGWWSWMSLWRSLWRIEVEQLFSSIECSWVYQTM